MSFLDTLRTPLHSASGTEDGFFTEAEDIDLVDNLPEVDDADPTDDGEELGGKDVATESDDVDFDDLELVDGEDLDDDELELGDDLEDLSDDDLDELTDDLDEDFVDTLADEEPVELDDEEEKEAEDIMNVAATSQLLKSEFNSEEKCEFAESALDAQIALNEGFVTESMIREMASAGDPIDDDLFEEKVYNKTKVQLSLKDRAKQLFWVAIYSRARAKNDPDYQMVKKYQAKKKFHKARLKQKYKGDANRMVKAYIQKLKRSKSNTLKSLGHKVSQ